MSEVHYVYTKGFFPWDYRSPDATGIGGSETHVIEVAWRLAKRGHSVTVYGTLPDDCDRQWRGTTWKNVSEVDYSKPGIWILSRDPLLIDQFNASHPDQILILVCQDQFYPTFTEERLNKLDVIMPLCPDQAEFFIEAFPCLKDKIVLSSNGIRVDLIEELEREGVPERNPYRIMHTSSPDRALANLLPIFATAKWYEPKLELHLYYGFENLDKMIKDGDPYAKEWSNFKRSIEPMLDQPGIVWHGRTNQRDLYLDFMRSGIWVYPVNFRETSCISSMESQALGAIPIYSPVWALRTNVEHGIAIIGDANFPLMQDTFAIEIANLAGNEERQAWLRTGMESYARHRFDWERVVDQFDSIIQSRSIAEVIA